MPPPFIASVITSNHVWPVGVRRRFRYSSCCLIFSSARLLRKIVGSTGAPNSCTTLARNFAVDVAMLARFSPQELHTTLSLAMVPVTVPHLHALGSMALDMGDAIDDAQRKETPSVAFDKVLQYRDRLFVHPAVELTTRSSPMMIRSAAIDDLGEVAA
jgi:hypothetical protein